MSNKELIDTLSKASENENNIALKMLLVMAAERIQKLDQLVLEMGWQISPEKDGTMNERVKKLTEQCYEKHELLGTYEFNKEKFAELIIKDCMGVVQNAVDHREPASTYVDKIKQHFGVEVQS